MINNYVYFFFSTDYTDLSRSNIMIEMHIENEDGTPLAGNYYEKRIPYQNSFHLICYTII